MSEGQSAAHAVPYTDLHGFRALKLLEVKRFRCDAQLRDFGPIRDRLVAAGQDGTTTYRQILARRDELTAELQRLRPRRPSATIVRPPRLQPGDALVNWPLTPAQPTGIHDIYGFGFAGYVQMGSATERLHVVPDTQSDTSGDIVTNWISGDGSVTFGGTVTENTLIQPQAYDDTLHYFWLRDWNNVVHFPAPPITSEFTCQFDVIVRAKVDRGASNDGAGLWSYVNVGQTADYVAGQTIEPELGSEWPIIADLTHLVTTDGGLDGGYNGTYGYIQARMTFQRSFTVAGGQVPALAVLVGVVCGLSNSVDYPGYVDLDGSEIVPVSTGGRTAGRVAFHYEPLLPGAR
jgi:hypothetical protein